MAPTDFPTVRKAVCETDPARKFLQSLGLKEPDLVDDVIEYVLPKYCKEEIDIAEADYEADVERILKAFDTDSAKQQDKLIATLKKVKFVRAVDAGGGSKRYAKPDELYWPTKRLKNLFDRVEDVLFVDDSQACLRGERVRGLLERCGAVGYLRPISDDTLSSEERGELRKGQPRTSDSVKDRTLMGLEKLLAILPNLDVDRQKYIAELLWNELAHLKERRGESLFTGIYAWFYHYRREEEFDAAFVQQLKTTSWVPGPDGKLHTPKFVSFDSLTWKEHPFLASKIRFKPPDIEELARKTGVDLEEIEFLKQLKDQGVNVREHLKELLPSQGEPSESKSTDSGETGGATASEQGNGSGAGTTSGGVAGQGKPDSGQTRSTTTKGAGARGEFISYIRVGHDEDEPDPDKLAHEARMNLEAKAIERILKHEPDWQRPQQSNNPGYDLYKVGESGEQARLLCEVKAMTGSLLPDRLVGISRAQFDLAKKYGESYWLYIVEHAGDDEKARIVKIQDPVGKARTFTFDRGWLEVAEVVEASAVESDV